MSNVSRSTFQKVVEENKRLKKDIIILTDEKFSMSAQKILLVNEWREKIRVEEEFVQLLSDAAKMYLEEHPEYKISK